MPSPLTNVAEFDRRLAQHGLEAGAPLVPALDAEALRQLADGDGERAWSRLRGPLVQQLLRVANLPDSLANEVHYGLKAKHQAIDALLRRAPPETTRLEGRTPRRRDTELVGTVARGRIGYPGRLRAIQWPLRASRRVGARQRPDPRAHGAPSRLRPS